MVPLPVWPVITYCMLTSAWTKAPLVTVPETVSTPFESVMLRLPLEGAKPLDAGQLMVNVPEKFSAALSAVPDGSGC